MTPTTSPTELQQSLRRLKPFFLQAAFFSLCSSLLILTPSWYMLEVYDRVVNSRSLLTLAMLTLVVLGAFVVMEVLEWARSEVMQQAGLRLDQHMRPRVFAAIFEANLRKQPGGSLQPMNDLRVLRDFLGSPPLMAAMEVPTSLVFLVLIFAISPLLGWSAVVGAIVQTLIAWFNERGTQPPLLEANRTAIAAQQYADGSLRNAQVIESMGMLKDIHRRWMSKQREFLGLQAHASDLAGGYQALSKFWQNTVSSALLGLGCWALLGGKLNGGAGMMIVASILGGRVLAPLVQLVSQWQAVVNARDAWGRLDTLLKQLPPRTTGMPLPAPRGLLQVEPLVAGAPGSPLAILRGVTFALQPGEALAVVGPSASGKTTLARLLVGIWPAINGKVRLDGADVHAWNKAELGPHVGYLPQGIELFDGTLAENIARFGPVVPAKVEAAARAVGLHDYIMSLPEGYNSPVGRDGTMLSGGQRQRVGLARALYGDPVFVVLDEPNSSLDEQGDLALAQAIQSLKAKGTTFVIMTHRTSVLSVVDKMLVIREGQAQAFGPRDEVLQALHKANAQAQGTTPSATAPRSAT